MAISGVSSPSYREQYEANGGIYADLDKTDETGESGSTEASEKIWNAVFEDKKSSAIDTDSFLALIVAQMTNQDFMNPMDDTAMVTQMVQMNTMQMMQEMAMQTKTSYVMGMVGKTVTAARISVSGELLTETGPVQKVTLTNNEFGVYVNGKRFTLEQIQVVGTEEALKNTTETDTSGGSTLTEEQTMQRKEYLNSLLGHAVTIETEDEYGSYEVQGVVEKVSSKNGEFRVYVKGEWYSLDSVTEVGGKVTDSGDEEVEDPDLDGVEDIDPSDSVNPDEKVDPDTDVEGLDETEKPDRKEDITPAEGVET